ncbi:MAG: antitoxin [Candidatus Bathyarchaeota archaeon B24]|nr:MAG: antitoxin [Candidatus Bathyarchaeota archaeon B24]MCD6444764.1 antitoxin family protein [Candidatus Bathyarchaeota archaeon]RLI26628.1 MAG: antitoxin [Candidatus Bathyarchaeota archaeon]
MSRIVEAVYEKGVLRPLGELGLKEGERVLVRIEKKPRGRGKCWKDHKGAYSKISEDVLKEALREVEKGEYIR